MKQILQNLKNGATELIDKPCPLPSRHQLFIKTSASLVSAGTERMLIDFGKGNYLQKARQQPDKVRVFEAGSQRLKIDQVVWVSETKSISK